jgi:pyruvate dehydrogenase E1 component beta subunit
MTMRSRAKAAPSAPADLTIVALGGVAVDAEEAAIRLFQDEDLICDVFMPTRLYPFDVGVLEPSLRQSRRLLVVEEGQGFVSMSSEIIAQAAERFGALGLCCRRCCATPNPIPAARPLEQHCLPGANQIVTKALEVVRESAQLHR